MKLAIIILFIPSLVLSQLDPRTHHHGACIVEFTDSYPKYYLTWSSAYHYGWEHNIYNSIVLFNTDGELVTSSPDQPYIGNQWDEAQEPVHSTINPNNNVILSVWEDGSDVDAPNVRGQLHLPNGVIIKSNWIIAGGDESQHSAQTAHISDYYAVFYADEAPPATKGAVVKAKIINDENGFEMQSISFTPNDEDHWWPISVSNTKNSRTLVIWGNDGYAVMGTVLYDNDGIVEQANQPKDYLLNTQQYYYHVEWLEELSKFLIVARHGSYENITDSSKVCMVDTMGIVAEVKQINGGILREAKMAIKWDSISRAYHVFYPSKSNELTHFSITDTGGISDSSYQIIDHPDLDSVHWVSTGIWATFVKDTTLNDEWNQKHIALFIMNDTLSNGIVKIPVQLSTIHFNDGKNDSITVEVDPEVPERDIFIFTNIVSDNLHLNLKNNYKNMKMIISIFNIKGQNIINKEVYVSGNKINIDMSDLSIGQYFYRLSF